MPRAPAKRKEAAIKVKTEGADENAETPAKKPKHAHTDNITTTAWPARLARAAAASLNIGAHVSAAGGPQFAVANAREIGATAFAFFLKNQRTFAFKPLDAAAVSAFKAAAADAQIDLARNVVPHGSYLINLANPDAEKRSKSYVLFLDDLQRCEQLGIGNYNFHPGSAVGECSVDEAIANIARCVNDAIRETESVCVLLENAAGQGSSVGRTFEELRAMIDLVDDKTRVGVCLDTCHAFAAGYDLTTRDIIGEFSAVIDLKYLKCVHVNDSKAPLGACKDRHDNIGRGKIGLAALRAFVQDPRLRGVPMILETPVDWANCSTLATEIDLLYDGASRERKA